MEDLDRHHPVERRLKRFVDRTHAPRTDLLEHLVLPVPNVSSDERIRRTCGHGWYQTMIPLLFESPLLRAAGFRHGFTSRMVNLRPPADVGLAKESVALALRFDADRLHQVEQVHGDRVIVVEGETPDRTRVEKADALIARTAGVAVGIRVADCVPILLADAASGNVAAVHAGWRGVELCVIEKTLGSIKATAAAIGPCIGPCCFEVGRDVADRIVKAVDATVVDREAGDKVFIDLRRAVHLQLVRAGITTIDDVRGCTRCDAEQFFSHRRDGDAAGRHLAVIVSRG
jgi:YfiH family protein